MPVLGGEPHVDGDLKAGLSRSIGGVRPRDEGT